MQKIKYLLAILALVFFMPVHLSAQYNAASDGVEMVLNMINIDNVKERNKTIGTMVRESQSNIKVLIAGHRMSSDSDRRESIEEALLMMAKYVDDSGSGRLKELFGNIIWESLRNTDNKDTNRFLISLLKYCSVNKDAEKLWMLKDNEEYADMAIRAAASIPVTADYIRKDIESHNSDVAHKGAYAYAIGQLKMQDLEKTLKSWLKKSDNQTKVDIYAALYELDNPNSANMVEKGAKKLYKKKEPAVKSGAMELLVTIKGEEAMKYLYKALKDKDRVVRQNALALMIPYANQEMYDIVFEKYAKGDAIADVADWMGDVKDTTHMAFLTDLLNSGKKAEKEASIRAICKLGGDNMYKIAPLIGGEYQPVIKKAMVKCEYPISQVLRKAIDGDDVQKLGVMEILRERRCIDMYGKIKTLINDDDPAIRDAAYKTLKNVVISGHGAYLQELLNTCDMKYVEDVQRAMMAAMKNANQKTKDNIIYALKYVGPDLLPRYYVIFADFATEVSVGKLVECYNAGIEKELAWNALKSVDRNKFGYLIGDIVK